MLTPQEFVIWLLTVLCAFASAFLFGLNHGKASVDTLKAVHDAELKERERKAEEKEREMNAREGVIQKRLEEARAVIAQLRADHVQAVAALQAAHAEEISKVKEDAAEGLTLKSEHASLTTELDYYRRRSGPGSGFIHNW